MKKKVFRRIAAAALAFMMVAQSAGGFATVQAAETTQMSSEKEVVYLNTYDASKREHNFDDNWKFYLGAVTGADLVGFDDSTWENVNVPHDYSIEQEYTQSGEAESGYLKGGTGWYRKHFTLKPDMEGKEIRIDFGGVYMNSTVWVNGNKLGTHPYGYTPFSYDITDYVTFDQENVITVKVDHETPSSRWYSGSGIFRSVYLTVMDKVHVDLYGTKIETPNLETEKGGNVTMNVATTVANEGTAAANVVLTHTVYEKGTDKSIGTVTTSAASVAAGESKVIDATLSAANPKLWGLGEENAHLYTVTTEVKVGGKVVDTYDTEFGFRYFAFDTHTGFSLNGEKVKLKGVCMHHDQGALGSEAYYRAIERQVEILQDMGCNSIRVTHNPAADELIKVANEKGLLLIEEVFDGLMYPKNGNSNDYSVYFETEVDAGNQLIGADVAAMPASDRFLGGKGLTWAQFDLTATIKRGQNSPAIFMWSLGNEIWEGAGGENDFPEVVATLIDWATALDDTRPATTGDNRLKDSANYSYAISELLSAAGGITGANYCGSGKYDIVYNKCKDTPGFALYGSETASHVNSRGFYKRTWENGNAQTADKQLTSYDASNVSWGATASSAWYDVITKDYVAGEYVWTGFDYLGEPTPWNGTGSGAIGSWPSPKNSYFGIIDTAGLPKDNYYFYQSQWNDEVTTLHVLPAWNADVVASGNVPIVVYSDAAAVELFFTNTNGQKTSLGKKVYTEKTTPAGFKYQMYEGSVDASSTANKNMYMTWYKAFEAGTIEAVAYDASGRQITDTVGRSLVTTTGNEAKVRATVDRDTISADGKDLAYITVDITDADGNIVPDASNNVKFNVTGDGVLVGVDNGKQADHQSFQDNNRDAYNGSLIAIVQSTKEAGEFTVEITSAGLESDTVEVTTVAVEDSTAAKDVKSFYMSKNYYAKTGTKVELPATIEARYTDGTSKDLPVVWDAFSATEGTFSVKGLVDGTYTVSVMINMIDDVAALLNYSTVTSVGSAPILPTGRQAVLADGTVIDVVFPVTWTDVAPSDYAKAGTFEVVGSAEVFGKALTVKASVRVQEEEITLSGKADPVLYTEQDIEKDNQSDTLDAIWDGSTIKDANNDGGANESLWSNYDNSQAGDTTAELTFGWATQQRVGEIVIYFSEDTYSAAYPDAGTTELYMDGADGWTKVEAKETIGTAEGSVKPYTYEFTPFFATDMKICVKNGTASKTVKPCTAITEIEIKKAVGSFTTNTEAELASLKVNGTAVSAAELATGSYYTIASAAAVEYTSTGNAAVTVLPAYEKQIVMIVESEDHKTRDTFVIYLEQERPLAPDDSGNDMPTDGMEAICDSASSDSGNEGPARYILDGNENTHWHTNWSTTEASDVSKRWVGIKLPEAAEVSGIRLKPRTNGGTNGGITEYKIQYRATDNGDWIDVASGQWEKGDTSWKLVTFAKVTAKQVRVVGVHTYDDKSEANEYRDGKDDHMSVAELRLIKPSTSSGEVTPPEAVETGIEIGTLPTKREYKYGEALDLTGLVVNVVSSDGTKEALAATAYQVDGYNAEKEGKQTVIVTYKDFVATFTVTVAENPDKPEVTPGVTPDVTPTPDKPGTTPTPDKPGTTPTPDKPADKPFRFDDVKVESAYYFKPVYWAYDNKITTGETPTTFAPDKEVNRAAMVTFIWRANGEKAANVKTCTFKDVDAAHFYYPAMLWAVEKGITSGYNADAFGPNDGCTRSQMVTFLWRAAGSPKVAGANPFGDISRDAYYYDAVLWAVREGITTGTTATTFEPDASCTRGQAVTFLARAYEK